MGNDPGRHWCDTLQWAAIVAIAIVLLLCLWNSRRNALFDAAADKMVPAIPELRDQTIPTD